MRIIVHVGLVLGTALIGAIVLGVVATLSMDDTIYARGYQPGYRVAQPMPGQFYEVVGGVPVKSPICWLEEPEAMVAEAGEAVFVNRVGQLMPSMVGVVSKLTGTGRMEESFGEFRRDVYEIRWSYDRLSLSADRQRRVARDCEAALQRSAAAGNCIIRVDTVLRKRADEARANPDGSISVQPKFAVSFRPECMLFCPPGQPCETRMWDPLPPDNWSTRVKLGMGVVAPI